MMNSRRFDRLKKRYMVHSDEETATTLAKAVVKGRPNFGMFRSAGIPSKKVREPIYRVTRWDDLVVVMETKDLKKAKKTARELGHTGEVSGKRYSPVARVDAPMDDDPDKYETLYNPRFFVGKHD